MTQKRRFSDKANKVLDRSSDHKPASMTDFLNDKESSVNTETSKPVDEETRRTVREEFKFRNDISDRLMTFVFDQKKAGNKLTKTDVAEEAIDAFLEKKGY